MTGNDQLALDLHRLNHWIEHYRRERGYTQDQLAVYAALSRSVITNIRQERPPSLRTVAYLAATLGVTTAELLAPIPDE